MFCNSRFFSRIFYLFLVIGFCFPIPEAGANSRDSGGLSMSPDAAGTNLPSLYAAGDALSVYTVDSAAKSSIPSGGIYSGIVMGSSYSSFSVPTGNVTLAGGPGQALVSPGLNYATASTRNPAAPIVVGSDTSAASLTLIEGSITGDIALGSGSYGRDATLIIGAGSTGETVSITGSVIGHLGSLGVSSLVINGSSLQVTGDIGLPNNTGTIRVLDAGGDITTRRLSSSFLGDLNAYRVSVRTGKKIDVAGAARVWNLFLEENSSLTANQPVKGAGRVDVQNVIDGGENGILAPGSKIVSTSDSVWLWEGVTRGSGEIRSGASIGSHQGIHYSPAAEVMVNPINQGDGGHLTLNAGVDISTGNVTVDSLSAGQDIVSGTEFPTNAPLAGRIYIKNNLTSGIFSPRGTITARWIKAGSGIYAGAMNIGGQGDEGSAVGVEASNLIVVRENPPAGATSLPSSTGDFLLNNGYFKLTGADVGRKYPQSTDPDSWTLTWGARIDGNAKVEDNGASSFKTMTVGGEVNISGGSLAGKSLRANSAVFSNLTSLSLNDDLNSADHPYALQTVGDMTIVGEQTANINTADAGGSVSATGGSYTGDTITARKDATFSNVSALTINDELTTASGDIAIRKNGVAKVGKLDSGGAFALSGGSYEGATIDTANDAVINGTTYFKVSGNTNIGGKLTATANDDMTFAALKIDENVVASGGKLSAASIETGAKSGANGDFTMTDGSFALGGASHIRGKLDADGNGSSSFGSLTVDGAIKAAGGSISGGTLAAATASFENLSKLEITDSLASKGDLTISGDGIANVKNSSANGEANISGVAYSGSVFSADKAVFSQMKNLSMSGKLATTGDLSIGMGNGNVAKIDEAESGGTLSLEGGSFSASSLKSGGDAELKNVSSASVSGEATIRGKLSVSGHGSASLGDLRVGETATIDGASLTAKSIETGTKSGSGGHLTVTNGSFDLGSGNAKAGTIHGNLTIDGLGSNSFTELVIDEGLNLSGGYLEGSALTAKTAVFKNNSIAHIDNFVLGGGGNALEIEEGSVVIVRAINNLSGLEEINDSGLIIAGDPSDPDSWSILGDVDLSQGVMTAEKALVQVNSIFGKGQGAKTDDVRAHQISAGNINIEDANIRLTGIGSYASSVRGDLAISENGDTRLGDISVGGETIISGGSVQARQFKATGNAVFNNTELTLLGTGERGSSFGDDLTITANTKSSLGDATVAGNMSATGGALTAGVLRANKNANFTGVELELGGSMSTPSEIGGDLSFVSNKSAKLGAITINGGLTADSGDLTATSLKVDKDANFDGVRLALNGVADNPDKIGGNLILSGDSVATTGSLEVGGELRAGGGSFKSALLKTGSGADFTGVDLALNGTEANPDLIGGDFNLAKNAKANLSYIEIGGKATVDGGDFTAKKLSADAADFSNTKSDVSSLDIKGVAEFAGGSFSADNAKTGSAIFREGIIASLKNMMLVDSGGTINVGDAMDTEGGTTVKIDALNLAGGTLKIGNIDVGPALVAVNGFAKGDGSADIINGHIAVGANGRLALGTKDGSWIPANLAEARATLALAQPTRLAAGTGMHVTGTGAPAPVGGRINFDADSLFIIDGANARTYYTGEWVKSALLDSSKGAVGALSSESSHTAVVADGARIYIKNPVPNTVIVALGQNIKTVYANSATRNRATTGAAWTGANLDYDNKDTVKIERLDGEYAGQFSVLPRDTTPTDPGQPDNPDQPSTPSTPENPDQPSPTPDNPSDPANPDNPSNNPLSPDAPAVAPSKPANTTHPAADPGIHDVIDHESGKGNIGDKPEHLVWHHGAGFISHTIANENPREATRLVEGAARIAVIGAVPQMTLLGNEAASSASERRVGIENMIWRDDDFHARSVSLWAVPLYRATGAWDMEAGNLDYDYHGGIGGVALGGDITFEDLIRAGLAFHIGGGYAKSEGELSETTNNMNFWGVGAYAGWIRDNFAVSADVNFTSTYNKLKQDVSSLPGWGELKGDARAYALSAGMKFEYKFETDFADIIPHAGFKYHYIHVYDYDINHRGSTIMSGEAFDQNIWTFPIGIKFAKNLELENGWTLRPSLDLRAIPAAGDIDAKTSIRFTETSRDIDLKTKTMDYIVWGGAIGLEATFGNLALGINYSLDAGAQSFANSVFGVVRYEF